MDSTTAMSRLQFAFTITYHYIFPQLTMGLALLIFVMKSLALRRKDERYNEGVRFWTRIFAITFIMGVVTGIPMEFQFGTNWARFSAFAGNVIAQAVAMEGAFAFFLESAFLGILLFGERRFGQRMHWFASLMIFLGTWASAFFIIVANAWMQHPVGYTLLPDGSGVRLTDYSAVLLNSWVLPQFTHTMSGAVITGSFVMAGVGAFYLLLGRNQEHARIFLTIGVIAGVISTIFQVFPSGDLEGSQVTAQQPVKLAAMEGLFESQKGAGIVILGQPDPENNRLDNPIIIPHVLSILTYRRWGAEVQGLDAYPADQQPDAMPFIYYSYHIMVGLGTIFIAIMVAAAYLLWRHRLFGSRRMLWILMLAVPFPFIANSAGWLTTELGRQPWIIYGLLRTSEASSANVSSGNVLFTLLGFAGMYLILGLLYVLLVVRDVLHGPEIGTTSPRVEERVAG